MKTFKIILCVLIIYSFVALHSLTAQSNTAFINWEGQVIEVFTDHIEVHFEDERFRDTVAVRLSMDVESVNFYDRQRGFAVMHIEEGMDIHTVIGKVRAINGVAKVGPSVVMRAKTVPNDTHFNLQYGPVITNMPLAWDITTGDASVLVGVIDSGIPLQQNTTNLSHEDLDNGARILLGNDYSYPQEGIRDLSGHGTHVTGILSAETDNGKGIAGSSWHNQILVVKYFNEQGEGTFQNFYNAVKYAVDQNVDIINFSGGATVDLLGTIENAVQYAYNNNVLLVAAAGNFDQQRNPDRIVEYPAAYSTQYDNVIAVSATNSTDVVPFFSSRGPEVNLSAPGENIYSTTPNYSVPGGYALNYDYDSGTSMAAPHVAGTAALVLSLNTNLKPSEIRTTLQLSADKVPGMGGQNFTNEYGYGRLNTNKAVRNIYVPQVYTNIATAVSAAVPGQTIYVSSGNYTLTSNITIPSGVTLTLLTGANVIFNGSYIDATNGVFNIQNGSTVYVTNGNKRYYGLFTTVQSAINFASSGRTVQLLSMTYPENISFSNKSNIALKGQGQGSTTLNGSISVTNSSSISVSNMSVTSPLTLNNASSTSLTNVTATGSRLANVYGGSQNQFGLVTATNIGVQEWALNIYGGTGDVYYSTISNADEVAIHLTNNASYNIGTNNMFCNNGYDIYAVGGGYAYAISNTYSRPLPSSIYGNVFITGVNYVCGGGGGGGMNAMNTTTGLQAVNHDMRTLDDTYLKLMRRMREDRENDTYDPARYSQEYRELIDGYKSLITNKNDISVNKAAILRVAQLYKAIEEENAFRTYTDNILAGGKFESLTPYFRRWELWDYVNANQYQKSLQIADEVLSSIGADDDLRAEMLYEKGLVYKYYLNDHAKSGEIFGMLIDKYPSSPLSRFAEGEMESEMYEFVQEEILEAEQLEEVLSYRLESYPNPFNPVTVIRFSLPSSGMAQLRVYDTLGRVVAVLADGVYEAGVHEAVFDASRLPSGMYFTRLEAVGQSLIHRMLLVK